MPSEDEGEPNLAKYYPVSNKAGFEDLSEITLKNISVAFLLLGLIALLVNVLMVFLFISQEWVIPWLNTSAAQIGGILICFGGALYLINFLIERRFK